MRKERGVNIMAREFVYGVYPSLNKAEEAVEALTGRGVSRGGIKLLANVDVVNHAQSGTKVEAIEQLTEHKEHWWEGLLDFFTFDDYQSQTGEAVEADREIDLSDYKEVIDEGQVVILVDGAFEDIASQLNIPNPEIVETPVEHSLPDNLHNPVTGASMADEPGVNADIYEDLTETEVDELDHNVAEVHDNVTDTNKASEVDPTIHEEQVERNTRTFENLRHPRENVTPEDVQHAFDDIRNPK